MSKKKTDENGTDCRFCSEPAHAGIPDNDDNHVYWPKAIQKGLDGKPTETERLMEQAIIHWQIVSNDE